MNSGESELRGGEVAGEDVVKNEGQWEVECGGEEEDEKKPEEKALEPEKGVVVELTPTEATVKTATSLVVVPGLQAAVGTVVMVLETVGVLLVAEKVEGESFKALGGERVEVSPTETNPPDTPAPPTQPETPTSLPAYEPQSIDDEKENLREFHDLLAKNSDYVPGLCNNRTARCSCSFRDSECKKGSTKDGKQFAGYFLAKFKACPDPQKNWVAMMCKAQV
ncbi:hypothetical protein HIM_09603 [Hirsutella minnesotensis 3608]|uniref:Uncharacterized protein n=1 Tax=Hirsutella minnesotensis 3608 TaxID=1043627 RepID=A0A0F7ZXM7_9HYPO|nr:hypothetical protein HIM_09603 [Hirsutella minnesotensis 3608]